MRWFIMLFGWLIIFSPGCASASIERLSATTYPPKPSNCALSVFTDPSRVKHPYAELAIITRRTSSVAFSAKGAGEIMGGLREQACEIGADALILKALTQGGYRAAGTGTAVAIRFQ
jgi:hypothetical protein